MMDQQIQTEERIVGQTFQKIFEVEYWVTQDYDDYLLEWQVDDNNQDKSLPVLLFYLLRKDKRTILREYYLERYQLDGILPEWETIPMYTELANFMQSEQDYFIDLIGEDFLELLHDDWEEVIPDGADTPYCDLDMFSVTDILHLDD